MHFKLLILPGIALTGGQNWTYWGERNNWDLMTEIRGEQHIDGLYDKFKEAVEWSKNCGGCFEGIFKPQTRPGQSRFLLDPKSTFLRYFDSWSTILLLFTATVTPYEVRGGGG